MARSYEQIMKDIESYKKTAVYQKREKKWQEHLDKQAKALKKPAKPVKPNPKLGGVVKRGAGGAGRGGGLGGALGGSMGRQPR